MGDLWEHLAELEYQAEAGYAAEREPELAERGRAEYARVPLAARLHASIGAELSLSVIGVGTVRGRLTRVGRDWLMLGAEDRSWVVRSAAVTVVAGASSRAVSEAALPPEAGLGLGSMLRHPDRAEWVFWTVTGEQRRGLPHRVGHDFVEVRTPGELLLIPFAALAAIQR